MYASQSFALRAMGLMVQQTTRDSAPGGATHPNWTGSVLAVHRSAPRPRSRALLLTIVAAAWLGGCSSADTADDPSTARYVAIGDSVAAGSGITTSTTDCQRSDHNYPSLVAAAMGIASVEDQTCGGATTSTVRGGRSATGLTTLGPQVDALSEDTDLVTVTLGANDSDVAALYFQGCLIPPANTSQNCANVLDAASDALSGTRESLTETLEEIVDRAPGAEVVVVGYPQLVPDVGSAPCAAVPVPADQAAGAVELEESIESAVSAAARAADVEFISIRDLSADHGPCSQEPWINGIAPAAGDGVLLHPTARGTEAIADRVVAALRSARD